MPEYLTTRELAELLRIKERKVYDLAAARQVPCTRATGKLLFSRTAVDAWLAAHGEGPQAASSEQRPCMLLGSHDPLLDWAVRESRCALATMLDSSLDGLERFAAGEGIATGLHVYAPDTDDWNIAVVAERFATHPVVLLEWAKRSRGLISTPTLHAHFAKQGLAGAVGHRLVSRQPEAGSQILLQAHLEKSGIDPTEIDWTDTVRSEQDAARTVQQGKADAAFGLATDADAFGLAFVPVVQERYDILIDRRAFFEPPWQVLLRFCQTSRFDNYAADLGGYDTAELGKVHFLGR